MIGLARTISTYCLNTGRRRYHLGYEGRPSLPLADQMIGFAEVQLLLGIFAHGVCSLVHLIL
jgi:hypothetical protein